MRDQHSGCVSEYLVENDLFDFLLLSLPDNDTHSHKYGPFAQVDSIAAADRQIARMMEPAGGPEKFLEDHAMIVCSDHSQSKVEGEIDLFQAFDGFGVRAAQRPKDDDEIAVCPNSRAAQVYVLDRSKRRSLIPRVERTLLALEGVDLVMRMGDHPDGEAIVRGERSRGVKELRFAPRGDLVDARGARWSVEGDLDLLGLKIEDDQVRSATYPDAMSRVWSALRCPSSGEVLASARPGYEFLDWGGAHHIGGGSHGSLHANDSNAALLWCGTGPEKTRASSGRCATSRRWCSSTSACNELVGQLDALAAVGEQDPRRPAALLAVVLADRGEAGAARPAGMSSKPTTESSGRASRTPSASWSLIARTAVTSPSSPRRGGPAARVLPAAWKTGHVAEDRLVAGEAGAGDRVAARAAARVREPGLPS